YYLIHSFADSVPGSDGGYFYCSKILVSLLDMTANGGLGKMLYKNQPVVNGNLGQNLSATKHGNGRDWWILVAKNNSNCFYEILLDASGVHLADSLCLGANMSYERQGASCFSSDGSKYASLNYQGLNIYDFDRCSGSFSNPLNLPLPIIADTEILIMGVAISPSNRFLYVSLEYYLYQLDLWSRDIFSNPDTVGVYDGWHGINSVITSLFLTSQLAPDGKIYIEGWDTYVYSVINNPDAKGDSCNFTQHSLILPTLSVGVPNFPNYRLGALSASACDSLSSLSEPLRAAQEQIIKVYPNPATDYAIVDYGFTDWNKGQPNLEICNALGQTIYTQTLPMYSGLQKIDLSGFAAGVYTVFIKRQGGVVGSNKLVVAH
ncbi:MAG TPA: T9SS type A sorting domain-containing protein, partial [Aquella sp.]|nr:T9SS type A sorting domain-containing protein [Aquella sp.]